MNAVRNLLLKKHFRRRHIEVFLANPPGAWARFDPLYGYLLNDCRVDDGINGSWTQYSYESTGERKRINYAASTPRISTYGDSYTHCHQASDGETWQEYLAAHLQESVRNFGVGGWSSYTAFLRMKQIESSESGAEYVILNVFDDDHIRNLDAARYIRSRIDMDVDNDDPLRITGIPWAHLRLDTSTNTIVHRDSLCPTAEDLLALCEPEVFCQAFERDPTIRLMLLVLGEALEDLDDLYELARCFGLSVDLEDPAKRKDHAWDLYWHYGFESTKHILTQAASWLAERAKKFLVLLTYSPRNLERALAGQRFDASFLEWIARSGLDYWDCLPHFEDHFSRSSLPLKAYVESLHIAPRGAAVWGHFTPMTNHLFAEFLRPTLVDCLSPKPLAYRV